MQIILALSLENRLLMNSAVHKNDGDTRLED